MKALAFPFYILALSFFCAFAISKYVYFTYSKVDNPIRNKTISVSEEKVDIQKIIASNPLKLETVGTDIKKSENILSDTNTEKTTPLDNIILLGLAKNPPKIIALVKINGESLVLNNKTEEEGYIIKGIRDNKLIIAKDGREISLDITALSKNLFNEKTHLIKESSVPATSKGTLNVKIPRTEIEKNLKDINSLIKNIFISPYYEGKNFTGYRISRIGRDSVLKKIGLSNGDIIVRINDESLENPQKMLEMLSKISDVTAVKIDILRKLKKETLFVEID